MSVLGAVGPHTTAPGIISKALSFYSVSSGSRGGGGISGWRGRGVSGRGGRGVCGLFPGGGMAGLSVIKINLNVRLYCKLHTCPALHARRTTPAHPPDHRTGLLRLVDFPHIS